MAGSLFKFAKKVNPYAAVYSEGTIAEVHDWLDTGFYALNAICSADIYRGLPFGRITTMFGPSESGKSLISAIMQKNCHARDMDVVVFDSEFDKDGRMEEGFGANLDRILSVPIESIEDLTKQAVKFLDHVLDNNEHGKYFFVVDSLGFLSSEKEIKDIDKNKVAMDMGLRAKMIKTFLRLIRGKVAKSKCPFLIINQEIADPGQMYDSIFKVQGGGKAIGYVSSVVLYINGLKTKQDVKVTGDIQTLLAKNDFSGQRIRLFTQKNRMAMPHKECDCYLNFASGIDQYSGMEPFIDLLDTLYVKNAQGEKGKGFTYYLDTPEGEIKLGKYKEWSTDKKVWDQILPQLNPIVNRELAFRNHDGTEDLSPEDLADLADLNV
jgi:RecA/RadA recombinase